MGWIIITGSYVTLQRKRKSQKEWETVYEEFRHDDFPQTLYRNSLPFIYLNSFFIKYSNEVCPLEVKNEGECATPPILINDCFGLLKSLPEKSRFEPLWWQSYKASLKTELAFDIGGVEFISQFRDFPSITQKRDDLLLKYVEEESCIYRMFIWLVYKNKEGLYE